MAEIGSCMYSLAQFSAHTARKHSQDMPNAWPKACNSTVPQSFLKLLIFIEKNHEFHEDFNKSTISSSRRNGDTLAIIT